MRIKVSVSEMGKAARLVGDYRKRLQDRLSAFLAKLLQAGVQIASAKIYDMNAIDTGDLDSSIYYLISDDGKRGWIRTDCSHAVYVEFGTGVMGSGSPHPSGMPGWVYDINGHGQAGWWYPTDASDPNPVKHQSAKDGSWWAWTRGMPSRPFMYETANDLSDKAKEVAREVFKL